MKPVDCPVIPEVRIAMVARIAVLKIRQVTIIRAGNRFADWAKQIRIYLPVIVGEKRVPVEGHLSIVIGETRYWMRIECCHMVNPNALCSEQSGHFCNNRATPAM